MLTTVPGTDAYHHHYHLCLTHEETKTRQFPEVPAPRPEVVEPGLFPMMCPSQFQRSGC